LLFPFAHVIEMSINNKREKKTFCLSGAMTLIIPASRALVIGRHVRVGSGAIQFDWPGVELRFDVVGTSHVQVLMDGGGAYYNISVEPGNHRKRLATHSGSMENYELARNLDPHMHYVISLQRRCDPVICTALTRYGPSLVYYFALDAGAKVTYGPRYPHPCLELVGDSDLAGFGVDASKPTDTGSLMLYGDLQDVNKSFGALVARFSSRAYHCVAWSGKGLCRQGLFLGSENIEQLYHRSIATSLWPINTSTDCDVALVYCGSNDVIRGASLEEFARAYESLLRTILRQRLRVFCLTLSNPASLSCVPRNDAERVCTLLQQGVRQAVERVGGQARHVNLWVEMHYPEDFALNMHWSERGHLKIAQQLHNYIR
jgi:hypothetical protein